MSGENKNKNMITGIIRKFGYVGKYDSCNLYIILEEMQDRVFCIPSLLIPTGSRVGDKI